MTLYETLFNFLLEVPQTVAKFGNWLVNPVLGIPSALTPLEIFGFVAFSGFIVHLLVRHIIPFLGI